MSTQKEREVFESWLYECHGTKTYLEESFDAWQAAKSQAIPAGFVLVPKEPTPKMIVAADNCAIDGKVTANIVYKAMIEAQEKEVV